MALNAATGHLSMSFSSIPEIVDELRRGRMVVIVDDEDRENEGDLVMAASCVRPEDINFMARYGRGLICLTLTRERCERLRLPLMVSGTHAKRSATFADPIHYRLQNEKTAERLGTRALPTEHGELRLHAYRDSVGGDTHYAAVKGEVRPDAPALVRVHMLDNLSDLFGAARSDAHWSLREALARISREGQGVVVVLRQPHETRGLRARMREYQMQVQGLTPAPPPANDDLRTYGGGAQILAELGVGKMRVLGTPKRLHGLAGFGLEVVEYVGDE